MKLNLMIFSALVFIILMGGSYAVCTDIDAITAEQQRCSAPCMEMKDLIAANNCVNKCNAAWGKALDDRSACLEQERIAEQQNLPDDSYPKYKEVTYHINSYTGDVSLVRNTVVFSPNSDFVVYPGDIVKTGPDSYIELGTVDSTSRFGPDTLGMVLGIDPANSKVISQDYKDWDQDPNYKYELDQWSFIENTLKDEADFIIKNKPDYLKNCFTGNVLKCVWSSVKFIYKGVGWFKEKMNQDSKSAVITRKAAIFPAGTEFIVEVAADGATTVKTLNGTVIVMDLASGKSVILEANQQIIISQKSAGLNEQELQQSITAIDLKNFDSLRTPIKATSGNIPILPIILLIILIAIVATIIKKRNIDKSRNKK